MTDPSPSVWTGIAADADWKRAEARHVEDKVVLLFDQLRWPLLRYLSSFNLAAHEAEEIVQDVFMALFRHLQAGRSETNLRAWVFRVGHNLALKRKQSDVSRSFDVVGITSKAIAVDPSPTPETLAQQSQTRQHLREAVEALPERDGRCLRLRAEGLRFREIAQVLGISVGAVSISLTRAVTRLARVAKR